MTVQDSYEAESNVVSIGSVYNRDKAYPGAKGDGEQVRVRVPAGWLTQLQEMVGQRLVDQDIKTVQQLIRNYIYHGLHYDSARIKNPEIASALQSMLRFDELEHERDRYEHRKKQLSNTAAQLQEVWAEGDKVYLMRLLAKAAQATLTWDDMPTMKDKMRRLVEEYYKKLKGFEQ